MPSIEDQYGLGAVSDAEQQQRTAGESRAAVLEARLRGMGVQDQGQQFRIGSGSVADQIPGQDPNFYTKQPTIPEEPGALDFIKRNFMSGGGGDIRNVMQALGPAIQAAGGLQQFIAQAQRLAIPAKAQGVPLDAADELFQGAVEGGKGVMQRMGQAGSAGWPTMAAIAGTVGGGGYAAYKVKEMMDARAAQMEALMKQMK